MAVYYNEIEPFAAQWLRNLIAAGHIAPGDVDERSIVDVSPDDLVGYDQCHFFAGIGVWSYALRLAGWPDDKPVWTGSCPCPPFSSAGKGQRCPECGGASNICHPTRTGHFICLSCGCDRYADGRHLWPELSRLIRKRRPPVFFGEQVASKDGRLWLAAVSADLERASYAVGASDICAACIGAPHIRQRDWFVGERLGEPDRAGREPWRASAATARHRHSALAAGDVCRLADADEGQRRRGPGHGAGLLDDGAAAGRDQDASYAAGSGAGSGLGDPGAAGLPLREREAVERTGRREEGRAVEQPCRSPERMDDGRRPGPADGFWRDADWLCCTDGKWRPVEPGTFPLADGAVSRVGRLRAYGNAIVAPAAKAFIEAYIDTVTDRER